MALADSLKALREVNLSELTLDNIGAWPVAVKIIVWVVAAVFLAQLLPVVAALVKHYFP